MELITGGIIFLLSSFVAAGIAGAWQRRSWVFEQRMSRMKENFDRKIDLVSEIFALIDARRTASYYYIDALKTRNLEIISEERMLYRDEVKLWGSKIPSLTIKLKTTFSHQICYDFDNYFPVEFSLVDSALRRARLRIERGSGDFISCIEEADANLHMINFHARLMSSDLLQNAEGDRLSIEQRPKISTENIQELTYSYLLKSLFKAKAEL